MELVLLLDASSASQSLWRGILVSPNWRVGGLQETLQ